MIRALLISLLLIITTIAYSQQWPINYYGIQWLLMAMMAVTAATFWRLQQSWPIGEAEYFGHIIVDIASLSALLYLSGGATNPLVSYYLIPISIAAATMNKKQSWVITASSISLYTLLLNFYQPLEILAPEQHSGHHGNTNDSLINLHLIGMWLTFVLSALLINTFIIQMAAAIRRREHDLNRLREEDLQQQQVMAVASLAAGTAHELGTPLNTMMLLIDEVHDNPDLPTECRQDLHTIDGQLQRCQQILKKLTHQAEHYRQEEFKRKRIDEYLRELLNHWIIIRPEASFKLTITSDYIATLKIGATMEQAIINLLNNAADACPEKIDISLHCLAAEKTVTITIDDHGDGIDQKIAAQAGQAFITSKGDSGLGLGLYLSHSTLNRYGGKVQLRSRPEGGTRTIITLAEE
ncbi:Sensor histidine kinase RegB [Sinobacterium norvegicum]|uniref:histidine kinase n=1 Tax=Sinobacterium norvegicum TaxID=1641715 RepID=A0ABN8EJN6_9GAMM|nr:ATP-binding protein [Sinobacterium norvegicum]CAH0992630.1 Sensor histidine kinase RegB [Sinobacterium norvegicum]